MRAIATLVCLCTMIGCREGGETDGDVDGDADGGGDADIDGDGDADLDADSDADTDSDGDTDIDGDTDVDGDSDTDEDGEIDDSDDDGYPDELDCDHLDAAIHPAAQEICNGEDDDCDGLVDEEDPDLSQPIWHVDTDGDGLGDPATGVVSCDEPDGRISDGSDCDDQDETILHEGVWFTDLFGMRTELTDTFSTGTAESPVAWQSTEAGTLRFCAGTWYTNLTVQHDLLMSGSGVDTTSLSGPGDDSVVNARYLAGMTLTIQDLTITNGAGFEGGSGRVGCGLFATGNAMASDPQVTVVLERVRVTGNNCWSGSGVDLSLARATLDRVEIDSNTASYVGGGLSVSGGSEVVVTNSRIHHNTAQLAAGIYAGSYFSGTASVWLGQTMVSDNAASAAGGGGFLEPGGGLICTGDAAMEAGFLRNTSAASGGALGLHSATVVSEGCDWGTAIDDNVPDDIQEVAEDFGADEDFTCGAGACW